MPLGFHIKEWNISHTDTSDPGGRGGGCCHWISQRLPQIRENFTPKKMHPKLGENFKNASQIKGILDKLGEIPKYFGQIRVKLASKVDPKAGENMKKWVMERHIPTVYMYGTNPFPHPQI